MLVCGPGSAQNLGVTSSSQTHGQARAVCADDPAVVDMLESHISRPGAGGESDAVFAWLYAWARSPAAPLQRFVARVAPSLAAQYLLRSASNVSSPGLEVATRPWHARVLQLLPILPVVCRG